MYIPLYVKSNYSLLESLITIDDLISYGKTNNLHALSLTDSNMYGAMEFYKKCQINNIKPIIGLEININNLFICLYAKNYDGYKNLLKLNTKVIDNEISIEDIKKYHNDLILVIPYKSIELYKELKDINDIYIGYENKNEEKLALDITKNIVFFNKILTLEENKKDYIKYLEMIRTGKTISDDVEYNYENNYLHKDDIYNYTSNVHLNNINSIIDNCNLEIPFHQDLLPIYEVSENQYDYLTSLCLKGLNKRLNNNVNDNYLNRLKYELEMIEKLGFTNYFLVVYDFILYAKKNNILVGPGRGSAAGSLVSYTLGITDIDPIKYDLLFERFLNPERKTMPDIDTDFPDIYRDQVIEYVKNKYGHKKVCGIVTFGTLQAKLVLRDTARIFNVPGYQIDLLVKRIPNVTKSKLMDFYNGDSYFKEMIDNDQKLSKMFKVATLLEGFPRHTSSHAAGIVICNKDIDDVIPLTKNDGLYLTAFPMEYLEEIGLLKMDFLGLKNLTTIMNVIDEINEKENIKVNFNEIPLDDKDTLEIFKRADTTGIFQFESAGMRNFLRNLKPSSFEDIFAAIALFRPGPASNIDSYIRRKYNKEKVDYIDLSLEPILKNTYGIIIYQEQIIQIACVYAGYTLGQADILRRAMSKKKFDILKLEEEKFIQKSIENNRDKDQAKEIFDLILKFANYGFNRSHSVAYSIVAYKMAYLKYHYPTYFYSALLTSVIGVETKTNEYINEIKGKGIKILLPSINKSTNKYQVENNAIRFPISNIKNIGQVASTEILKIRNNESFIDIYNFFNRINSKVLKKQVIESLIFSGALNEFNYNYKTLINNLDELINYSDLCREIDSEFVLKPEIQIVEDYQQDVIMNKEKELFGTYLKNHPVSIYKANNKVLDLNKSKEYFNKIVEVIGVVDKVKKITTKKGDLMSFITISDETGILSVTLFPKIYQDVSINQIIKVKGRIEKRFDEYQLIAENINILK